MRILFTNITEYHKEFYVKLCREMSRRGHEVLVVTNNKEFEEHMKLHSIPCINLKERVNRRWKLIDHQDIAKRTIEKEYGIDLETVYVSPYLKTHKPKRLLEKEAESYIIEWEPLLKKYRPDLIVNISEMILCVSCEVVARKLRTPMIHTYGRSIFEGELGWATNDLMNDWIENRFLRKNLKKDDIKKLDRFLAKFKKGEKIIGGKPKPLVTLKRILTGFWYIYEYYFKYDGFKENISPFKLIAKNLSMIVKRILYKPFYHEFDRNKKYIYFPVHVPEDANITLRCPEFYRQDEIIEKIAESLPKGYLLYIKEHPHEVGSLRFSWLTRIVRNKNVVLLKPGANSHEIIKSSCGIVVIRSNVGWEALLYEKPVVVLGNPFYAGYGLTIDSGELNDMKDIIERLLKWHPDKKKIYRLLYAARMSSYKGQFGNTPSILEEKNIKNIAGSILDKYKKL